MAALGGILAASYIGNIAPSTGTTLPLEAIAACVIGGLALTGGAARSWVSSWAAPSSTGLRTFCFLVREMIGPLGLMRMKEMRDIASHVLRTIVAIEGIDSPDKLVGSLSGGQKQAVAIARAVHFKRTLLVLDEPTSALAVRATEALFEYLRWLRAQGLSSVLVTHNLYDAYRICDRFVVMGHGEVVYQATQAETSVETLTEHVSRG
jgi:simple sugar transport system ATP-binding protein